MDSDNTAALQKNFPWVFTVGVPVLFFLNICTLFVFALGSSFSSEVLVTLLWFLQFFAGFLSVLSLCALIYFIVQIINKPRRLIVIVHLIINIFCGFFGVVLFLFDAVVKAVIEGNI